MLTNKILFVIIKIDRGLVSDGALNDFKDKNCHN